MAFKKGETVADPEEIIRKLRQEIKDLRNKPRLIKEVQIVPADYEDLKRDNRQLTDKCKRLTRIIQSGRISTLATELIEFESYCKAHLRRIAHEARVNDYSQEDMETILKICEYLSNISAQLYGQASIYRQGRLLDNSALWKCDKLRSSLMEVLSGNDFIDRVDPSKADVLCHRMKVFRENLLNCFKEQDEDL